MSDPGGSVPPRQPPPEPPRQPPPQPPGRWGPQQPPAPGAAQQPPASPGPPGASQPLRPDAAPAIPSAVSRQAAEVVVGSAPLIASLAISVGVIVVFVANLFIALGAPSGTSGKVKLLEFLSPSDVSVAAAMILAVALVALHQQQATRRDEPVAARAPAHGTALVAGVVGALVAVAAIVRAIVSLTISEKGALKAGNFIDGFASALVAAAAALWGLHRIHTTKPQ